ncbi:lantibiotic dehydratase [Nocardia neocaledoniensis]|uniref:Lantibiotic biosynthesis dehydratase-like protein n=1 Tax=Nocardia neocaledoniensis TaxID=236511 RepID=A0A317N557_9NOCA|nr:lantibiotic dehydratase [Nocardia neocaledoniensis]PWV70431.1 lantibiotic biosynthesis dehydratase-like protein [Nocardia neocaledoniensis]
MMLRQAGFPLELLDPLVDADITQAAAALDTRKCEVERAAERFRELLRSTDHPVRGECLSRIGERRPLSTRLRRVAIKAFDGNDSGVRCVAWYQRVVAELRSEYMDFGRLHRARMDETRRRVVQIFDDNNLREVLLVSNDTAYPQFATWLDAFNGTIDKRARKITDLLTMYLQRVTTKNETNSHFGPVTAAEVRTDHAGIRWTADTGLQRHTFLTHWAAQALADTFRSDPRLNEHSRPRRTPLTFVSGHLLDRYAHRAYTGPEEHWQLRHLASQPMAPAWIWLWHRCDGDHTLAQLRRMWAGPNGPGDERVGSFDAALAGLIDYGVVAPGFEIPVGTNRPMHELRDLLNTAPPESAATGLSQLQKWEPDLERLPQASLSERETIMARSRDRFELATGRPPHRYAGHHYADRGIFFEEADSGLRQLSIGSNIAAAFTDDLRIAYEIALAGPRLLMRREHEILTAWFTDRFPTDSEVSLDRFYRQYFRDRDQLVDTCAEVAADVAALEQKISNLVFVNAVSDAHEIVVPPAASIALLELLDSDPPAVIDADILFAAADPAALTSDEFLVVVGEIHAARELLTHSSAAPLLQRHAPQLLPTIHQGYLSLLADDEILVDVVRDHADKTITQLMYPGYDLEVSGRSPKPRSRVLIPSQLSVALRDGRLGLYAEGLDARLRLTGAPAGGPSIVEDPLSPLTFPRHMGGSLLRTRHMSHVPRVMHGRVVLHRETWRFPLESFEPSPTAAATAGREAALYLATQNTRRQHRLPRHMFAKINTEMKPVYVDWDSPLLVRQFLRLLHGNDGEVELSEMLPAPGQRWLTYRGHSYTSELRAAIFL